MSDSKIYKFSIAKSTIVVLFIWTALIAILFIYSVKINNKDTKSQFDSCIKKSVGSRASNNNCFKVNEKSLLKSISDLSEELSSLTKDSAISEKISKTIYLDKEIVTTTFSSLGDGSVYQDMAEANIIYYLEQRIKQLKEYVDLLENK